MLTKLSKKFKPPEHAHLVGHVQLLGAVEVEHAVEVGWVAVEVELVVLQAVPSVDKVKNFVGLYLLLRSKTMINHMCLILIFVLLFNSYASASSRISSWVRALASLPSLVRGLLESIFHITWGENWEEGWDILHDIGYTLKGWWRFAIGGK